MFLGVLFFLSRIYFVIIADHSFGEVKKTPHLILTPFHFMDTLFGPYLAEEIWQRDKVMAIAIHFCTINLTPPKGNLSSSLRSFYTRK